RDTIPSTVTMGCDLVTERLERGAWKVLISALGLLEQEHIGFVLFYPSLNSRKARAKRVHIPRHELHRHPPTMTKNRSTSQARSPSTVAVPRPVPARVESRPSSTTSWR